MAFVSTQGNKMQPVNQTQAAFNPNSRTQTSQPQAPAPTPGKSGGSLDDWLFDQAGSNANDYDSYSKWLKGYWPGRTMKKGAFESARIRRVGNQLGDEAKDFESNIDNYANDQYGLLKREVTDNLDKGLEQTRKNYSSRGLLYSGLRQGAEADKRGEAAGLLAQGRASINTDLSQMAQSKKQIAAQVGLAGYQQALDSAHELSNMQMQNALARRKNAASLGQGLGYAIGSFAPQGGSQPGMDTGFALNDQNYDYYDPFETMNA